MNFGKILHSGSTIIFLFLWNPSSTQFMMSLGFLSYKEENNTMD